MAEAQGAPIRRAKIGVGQARRVRVALMIVALGFLLGGCGNCGGWTNPWYRAAQPHSCE
ncbi:MAG: hypothetical protein JO137_08275 [Hyphomicrobiales bacterium]|nr:hypothetical protein [Hyphomicrobiales bacterium]MBV8765644.1 hypothetical protein [Hyphomicrobiales bacterium]MBV9431802.1 hypothetical protein [Hyphomicrobiales bacterium]MBW0004806.1 hypothetical protein [Hyphomicrobiales bacterium]